MEKKKEHKIKAGVYRTIEGSGPRFNLLVAGRIWLCGPQKKLVFGYVRTFLG